MSEPLVTVVTTCRGRWHHLQETLPRHAGRVPVVAVDYGCPDGTAFWLIELALPGVTVVRRPAAVWNTSAARNDGLSLVRTPFVAFVDADTIVRGDLSRLVPDPNSYYVAHHDGPPPRQPELSSVDWFRPTDGDDLCGFMMCPTAAARAVGGYSEAFSGWGAEDTDFRTRLAFAGLSHGRLPAGFLKGIPHGNGLRHGVADGAEADRLHAERVERTNRQYREAHAHRTPFVPPEAPPLVGG